MAKRTGRKRVICMAQINYDSRSIEQHVDRIKGIVDAHKAADLIVFPELILHGHPSFEKPEGFLYRRMKIIYRAVSEDLYRFVRAARAKVIIGELKRWGEKYYNMATYIDARGVQTYTKTHVHWTENFAPGRQLKVFDSPMGKVGINICFDAAFSEVWRILSLKGADLIVNISAVPKTFPVEYMRRRMTGAALNNETFVVYANRPGPFFSGHSGVFGPNGDLLATAGAEEQIIQTVIDLEDARRWRMEEPIFPHRRPLLYREIADAHRAELPIRRKGKKRQDVYMVSGDRR